MLYSEVVAQSNEFSMDGVSRVQHVARNPHGVRGHIGEGVARGIPPGSCARYDNVTDRRCRAQILTPEKARTLWKWPKLLSRHLCSGYRFVALE